jgi:hypothetical protein
MSSRGLPFTKALLARVIKGAESAGLRINPDGSVELQGSAGKGPSEPAKAPLASWDDA